MRSPTLALLALVPALAAAAAEPRAAHEPPFRALDLDRGEVREVELPGGRKVKLKLLDVREERDALRSAVRRASVRLEVDGAAATVPSGNYHLPVAAGGVQVDCPVTKGYYPNHDPFEDSWGLVKDARVRVWPKDSPWLEPGTFVYPLKQRWFASATQIGNEPSYVDGGDNPPARRPIYYHAGNDLGGCEGLIDVVSACDGVVASARGEAMSEYADAPFYKPRGDYDYVYVVDARGWFYRYAHLHSIDPAVRPGSRVKAGQKIGVLGKEGSSGGWAHLHFDIKAKQPSGRWGVQDAYPFLFEAYRRQFKPKLVAVARPHHLAAVGETLRLDASRSWSAAGAIARYDWAFGDGATAGGPTVERTYNRPGSYSEVLKVTDAAGEVDYDFAIVQVVPRDPSKKLPPTIHAAYAPTFDIRPNDPVTFKVRTFRTPEGAGGNETWDFGDGTDRVTVHSGGGDKEHAPEGYAVTQHRFERPGDYVVRVEGRGADSMTAVGHLHVRVTDAAEVAP
jgi:murein DD-endopeptidase MepM/ murein hydrolase activator NlpD